MKIDLDDLERKARAATQDLWERTPAEHRYGGGSGCISARTLRDVDGQEDGEGVHIVSGCGCCESPRVRDEDAEHIVANSPLVTIAVVEYIRKLEAVALQYARRLECNSETDPYFEDRDRMRALVAGGAVLP